MTVIPGKDGPKFIDVSDYVTKGLVYDDIPCFKHKECRGMPKCLGLVTVYWNRLLDWLCDRLLDLLCTI